ncbi:creatininase family protein [Paraburkholderia sediminicola]|uniref:creatininase family protein n=1 Tax=Paraburkholderia sediminicola TaxID=458836 RepID=UPI0038B9C853
MTNTKYRLAELTADEMRQVTSRSPVILLPMGSFEDQGPHAPTGDYLSAAVVAEQIAKRASQQGTETYVAPVVPFGGCDFFGYMPGCISLSQSTLRSLLDDMLNSLLRHGLTQIVIVNGHGGNCGTIHDATQRIWLEQGVIIPSFYLWRVAYTFLPEIIGEDEARASSGHGGNPLTSVAMHLFPDLVREDLMAPPVKDVHAWGLPVSGFDTVNIGKGFVTVPLEGNDMVPNAIYLGDPRLCSAAVGKQVVDRLVEIGTDLALHVKRHTDPSTGKSIR